jgi:hypothetical protein
MRPSLRLGSSTRRLRAPTTSRPAALKGPRGIRRLQDARGTDDRTLALMRLAGQSRETSPVECGSVVLCEPGVGLAAAPAASCLTLAYTVHRRQRHGEPHPQRDVAGARLHRIDRHRARASAHRSHMRCNASSITLLLCRAQRPAGASEPAPAPAPAAACKRGRWQTPNTPCKGHAAMHEVQLSPCLHIQST